MSISVTWNGKPPLEGVCAILQKVLAQLDQQSGKEIRSGLLESTRQHMQQRWPGSTHFSPRKVQPSSAKGSTGEISVNAAGITRAFHDVDIFPKSARALSIPIHKQAYGRSPRDFSQTFILKKRDGNTFIAQWQGSMLALLYVLKGHVHQRQDRSMLPSDQSWAEACLKRISSMLTSKSK